MTPKVDNKRPKSVQAIKSTLGVLSQNISSSASASIHNEKINENTEESGCNYLVILQNLKPDDSLSSSQQEEVKKDFFGENKIFQDSSEKDIILTGTDEPEQVKEREIETFVTFPTKDDVSESENAIICEFSESDVTPVTRGIETCIVGELDCEHSTFYSDEEKPLKSPLLYDKQFSLVGDDSSTFQTEIELKCQQEENANKMGTSFGNETYYEELNNDDLLKNASDHASQDEEIVIGQNCTDPLAASVSDESNENEQTQIDFESDYVKPDYESDDDQNDNGKLNPNSEASSSSESDVDTSVYVNYPEDLRPSRRLPQRLTSRRSTTLLPASLLCTGADMGHDWDLEHDKRGHGGCWNWLSTRF